MGFFTSDQEASDKILTIPNLVSFIRLCLIPVYMKLLLDGSNGLATLVFSVAALTDFVDGQIARRTNSISKLGQILDPLIDRLLMIFGVLGLLIVGRLPIWIVVVVLLRDVYLLAGGAYLIAKYRIRVPVIFLGKVATTFLFVGFGGLLLNVPLLPGLALTDISWLPGFNEQLCSWGIWFVYIGMILTVITTTVYTIKALRATHIAKQQLLAANAQPKDAQEAVNNNE